MKKEVREILEAIVNYEDENTIIGMINNAYESGKITWEDHGLLIDLLSK